MFVLTGVMGSGARKEVAIWAGKSEIGSRVLHCARGGSGGVVDRDLRSPSIEILGRDPNHGRSEITERVARSETPERTIFGSSVDRDQRRPKVAIVVGDQIGGGIGARTMEDPTPDFTFACPNRHVFPSATTHYPCQHEHDPAPGGRGGFRVGAARPDFPTPPIPHPTPPLHSYLNA